MSSLSENRRRCRAVLLTGVARRGRGELFSPCSLAETPSPRFGWDFRPVLRGRPKRWWTGVPLYMDPDDPGLPEALDDVMTYVYPPQVAVVLVPVTVLRIDLAQVLSSLRPWRRFSERSRSSVYGTSAAMRPLHPLVSDMERARGR